MTNGAAEGAKESRTDVPGVRFAKGVGGWSGALALSSAAATTSTLSGAGGVDGMLSLGEGSFMEEEGWGMGGEGRDKPRAPPQRGPPVFMPQYNVHARQSKLGRNYTGLEVTPWRADR